MIGHKVGGALYFAGVFALISLFPVRQGTETRSLDITSRVAVVMLEDAGIVETSDWRPTENASVDEHNTNYVENVVSTNVFDLPADDTLCLAEASRDRNASLLKALLAAELYNRTGMQRWIEKLVASISVATAAKGIFRSSNSGESNDSSIKVRIPRKLTIPSVPQ